MVPRWVLFFPLAIFLLSSLSFSSAQDLMIQPGKKVRSMGNAHIDDLDSPHAPYNTSPPTSGPHVGGLAEWGVHKEPVPDELQVHNLEDGGVIIQYNCESCDELISKLEAFAGENKHIVVAPYPEMKTRIALTAWQRIDTLEEFDQARIERFIRAYMGIDHHLGF
ncbi:MAG TPA: DUF3105 domain-containing protein [Nitrospiria bacterium]